jgi:hypothetical protein
MENQRPIRQQAKARSGFVDRNPQNVDLFVSVERHWYISKSLNVKDTTDQQSFVL